jgi:hypothetical protein
MNEENFNEITLSGTINHISQQNKFTFFGLTCKSYSKTNSKCYASLRIYEDLYNKYKDFFVIGKKIYVKGYMNSYIDSNRNITNYVMVTDVSENSNDLMNGTGAPHIRYDPDGVMVWNGKRCEIAPASPEEQKEMEDMLSRYKEEEI